MKCDIQLEALGWLGFNLEVNGQEFNFSASYLSEPLHDLFREILFMIPGCDRKKRLKKKKSSFKWDGEGDEAYWDLELLSDSTIKIKVRSDYDGIKIDTICDLFEFLESFTTAIGGVIKKHGFIGYNNTWDGFEFPVLSFIELRYYAVHRKPLPLEIGEKGICNSNFKQEIALLSSFLE